MRPFVPWSDEPIATASSGLTVSAHTAVNMSSETNESFITAKTVLDSSTDIADSFNTAVVLDWSGCLADSMVADSPVEAVNQLVISTEDGEESAEKAEPAASETINGKAMLDIYKLTDSSEKRERLAGHQQHQSNMIHDLIIGRTKQRRQRQPRVLAPISSVPAVPPAQSGLGIEEFTMIDEDDSRPESGSGSPAKASPKVLLPPTPITNPEKFGISVAGRRTEQTETSRGSIASLVSPTESTASTASTDCMDGIRSGDSSAAASPSKTPSRRPRTGFMAAVAGIFRTGSPSSPASSPALSPTTTSPSRKEEGGGLLARWGKTNKGVKEDGVERAERLARQASHPSTPPVPLSRRIKLGSQPPLAREDSFSEEEEEAVPAGGLLQRLDERQSRAGRRAARQAASVRVRRAQQIQRELEVCEVECAAVEQRGVELERRLRAEGEGGESMGNWLRSDQHFFKQTSCQLPQTQKIKKCCCRLLKEKNQLVRREQELMVEAKQLELEVEAERLECELARLGDTAGPRQPVILGQLVQKAEQRELLAAMLTRDQERYKQEDRDLELRMQEQGIK